MASLTLMYGPPASGKSTYAESRAGVVVVDLERLVIENATGVGYAGLEFSSRDQWQAGKALAEEALRRGDAVIFDYFAVQGGFRRELRDLAERVGVPAHLVIFDAPLDVCLARNAGRAGQKRLPEDRVRSLYALSEAGREQVAAEPWAAITAMPTSEGAAA
jgi:predicted kinase